MLARCSVHSSARARATSARRCAWSMRWPPAWSCSTRSRRACPAWPPAGRPTRGSRAGCSPAFWAGSSLRVPEPGARRRTVREGTSSTARNAPRGRDSRQTRSAISRRPGRASKAPSAVRRPAPASRRAQARVDSALRRTRIPAAQAPRRRACARAPGLVRRPQETFVSRTVTILSITSTSRNVRLRASPMRRPLPYRRISSVRYMGACRGVLLT